MYLRLKGKQSTGEQNNSRCWPDPVLVTKGFWECSVFPPLPPRISAVGDGGRARESLAPTKDQFPTLLCVTGFLCESK